VCLDKFKCALLVHLISRRRKRVQQNPHKQMLMIFVFLFGYDC
jgi:hypothetical protein